VKRACSIGLAPMRLVVAAVTLVPSAAPATVACRVLVMSTWILRRSGRADPAPHERTRLHHTRDWHRHDRRSRVPPFLVGERVRVGEQRRDLGVCGGRRHR
jgi:hypothetical protein